MARFLLVTGLLLVVSPLQAQNQSPQEADVASPEAIVAAAYESISRAPGEPFPWERFRSLYLPEALFLPNIEQTDGVAQVFTSDPFTAYVESLNPQIGSSDDKGFVEKAIHNEIVGYGDIAHVFSSYQKHDWEETEDWGRGINSFQLVYRDGRWWIVSVAWDEENGAGPIPEQYLK